MSQLLRYLLCAGLALGPLSMTLNCDVDVEGTAETEADEENSGESGENGSSEGNSSAAAYTLYCDQGDSTGCFVLEMDDPSSIEETAAETACETAGGSIESSCDGSVGICEGLEFFDYEVDYYYDAGVALIWEGACNLLGGSWSD